MSEKKSFASFSFHTRASLFPSLHCSIHAGTRECILQPWYIDVTIIRTNRCIVKQFYRPFTTLHIRRSFSLSDTPPLFSSVEIRADTRLFPTPTAGTDRKVSPAVRYAETVTVAFTSFSDLTSRCKFSHHRKISAYFCYK